MCFGCKSLQPKFRRGAHCALLKVNPEHERRKSFMSKPVGRTLHVARAMFGLKKFQPLTEWAKVQVNLQQDILLLNAQRTAILEALKKKEVELAQKLLRQHITQKG